MKLYAIFGNPVNHSISPLLHNYTFKKIGFKGCYTRVLIPQGEKLKEIFLELKLKGVNITVPHKEIAYRLSDEVRGVAKEIEAVNTWIEEKGKIVGYNTDAPGFYESVKEFEFKKVLILGAGGTAKAIALYLRGKGYEVVILNRSESRLSFFKERGFKTYTWEEFEGDGFELIVNTTSAGLNDQLLPAPKQLLKKLFKEARYAVDVIYNKLTPFLTLAKEFDLEVRDGTLMLLYQAVLANKIFTNFPQEEIKKKMFEAIKLV